MYIEGTTIDDTWRSMMAACVQYGIDYRVTRGSYEGQLRKQFSNVMIKIKTPWVRPLAPILPPPWPSPTTDAAIQDYFVEYLMSTVVKPNEDYTYGSYIVPQIDAAIEILNVSGGGTNQACVTVGDRESIKLADPPCLKVITFDVVQGRLVMSVFFRSWDAFAGFPQNMGGLQLLKELVLEQLTFACKDAEIYCYSSGLHLYEQYWDLVDQLCYGARCKP
jgi:thymidylate synthase